MIEEVIAYQNTKIEATGLLNKVYGIAERVEREGKVYPAIYSNAEYININLDSKGSLSYWRQLGNTRLSEENSTSIVGMEYKFETTLRLVVMMKKESIIDSTYFDEKVANELIGNLTTNLVSLKQTLKAKTLKFTASQTFLDGRLLAVEEYEKIDFEPRYDWAYFAIDFNFLAVSNQNCFQTLC